jgi:glycosyltransferase involved in cell wall biosynthesis
MKNNPQVAIMMPVYNGEKTLPLAVASLINQTYPDWKCYIVNDGSTDGTKAYLDSLIDERFVIIHFDKNKGRPYARQAALDAAEGKYLAFLDADDFYHPEKLEKQVSIFRDNPELGLVSCANASFGKEMEILTVRGEGKSKISTIQYKGNPPVALRTSLIDLSIAKNIEFDKRLKHAQDTDYLNSYFKKTPNYLVQPDILYYYSEFESVTFKKIIKTYYYNMLQLKTHYSGVSKYINISKVILKIFINTFLYVVKGNKYILQRRGRKVTESEFKEFTNLINQLRLN